MPDMMRMDFKENITKRLALYDKKLNLDNSPGVDQTAKIKLGLQLLNWVVNGSSNESVVPPIMHGILRGSGTVFVGSKKVGDMKNEYREGTPASSYSGKKGVITIGFNTAYAARLHEINFVPGGKIPSKQAQRNPSMLGDVGNKFVERHLKADGKALLKMYAAVIKRLMK